MKMNRISYRIILTVTALFAAVSMLQAADPWAGTLSGTNTYTLTTSGSNFKVNGEDTEYSSIGAITIDQNADITIVFNTSATVNVSGTITLLQKNGKLKLELGNSYTNTDATLQRAGGFKGRLFYVCNNDNVSSTAKAENVVLSISGNKTQMFEISGGAEWSWSVDSSGNGKIDLEPSDDYKATDPLIAQGAGTVNLSKVHFYNAYNVRDWHEDSDYNHYGAVILLRTLDAGKATSATSISDCLISHCYSMKEGPFAVLRSGTSGVFSATDCTVKDCFCTAPKTSDGGTIRSYGNGKTNLNLTNTTFQNNYNGKTGSVTWNSAVDAAIIDHCEFLGNISGFNGAGLCLESSAFITSCKFKDNIAKNFGGGIYYTMFSTNNTMSNYQTDDYILDLDTETVISGNKAVNGGGIYLGIQPVKTGSGVRIKNKYGNDVTVSLYVNGSLIENNTSTSDGGGIYINKETSTPENYITNLNVNYGTIQNNEATNGKGGGFYTNGNVPVKFGSASGTLLLYKNKAKTDGGAAYINGADVTITNGTFEENDATTGNGGAICVASGNVSIEGGTTKENTASLNGGGIYVGDGDVTVINGTVSDNTAGNLTDSYQYGGGIYAAAGDVKVSGGIISGNTAAYGGGIGMNGSASGDLTIDNGTISGNHAVSGGGISMNKSASFLKVNGGTISGNDASQAGGGIHILSGTVDINGGSITSNETDGNGGGIYVDGQNAGKSNLSITNGIISSNSADGDGGGVYLVNKAPFTMRGGEIISNNAVNGAGARSDGTFSFYNGLISNNVASDKGGGLYAINNTVSFTEGVLNYNQAKDGGGVYLQNSSKMSYNNGGYICFNKASSRGGGVYLDAGESAANPTSLDFNTGGADVDLGLYSNEAYDDDLNTNAGDDIYAVGGTTKVVVPNIAAMKLEGYSAPGAVLHWYEDYSNDDPRYSEGTQKGPAGYSGLRYRKQRDALSGKVYYVDDETTHDVPTEFQTKYLALTMGFKFESLFIRRKGLCKGEQAIYDIEGPEYEGKPYRQRIVIFGTDAVWDGVSIDIEGLPSGEYTVKETSWAWYNQSGTGSVTGPLKQRISDGNGTLFSFENTHESESATPMHDEKYKVNDLR